MKDRERKTAERFNILEQCEKLEKELLNIDRVIDVDFDLNGFYDDIYQVIILTKYDIPATLENYFEERRELLKNVIGVAALNDLTRTEDRIEDMGAHFYFVFRCGKEWRKA